MDPFYILAIVISTVVFIILPLLLIGLIFKVLKKTNKLIAVTISFILLTALSYFLITDFYPTETFYTENFEDNTQLTLPNSKRPLYFSGNSSIYSFGDYNISYSYKFTIKDYDDLYTQLMNNGLRKTEKYLETDENRIILGLDSSIRVEKILTKDLGFKSFDVLFMDDNQTIVFNSNKW